MGRPMAWPELVEGSRRFCETWESLQLPPDILELIKAFLSGNPLCPPHRPLRKSATRLSIVTNVDCIVLGIEHQFMHANHVTFAKGRDLDLCTCVLLQYCLHGRRRPRWRILFLRVVALVNTRKILMLDCRNCAPNEFEEQVHANREIRAIEKRRSVLLNQLSHAIEFRVP